jgi:hypothetical protein
MVPAVIPTSPTHSNPEFASNSIVDPPLPPVISIVT